MSALAKTLEGTRNTRPGEAGQGSVFLAMTLPSWRTVIFGMRTRVSVHISSRWRAGAGSPGRRMPGRSTAAAGRPGYGFHRRAMHAHRGVADVSGDVLTIERGDVSGVDRVHQVAAGEHAGSAGSSLSLPTPGRHSLNWTGYSSFRAVSRYRCDRHAMEQAVLRRRLAGAGQLPARRSSAAGRGVDGHSGSGKTTLARGLAALDRVTAVVHTDDLAWHHSFFGWGRLLIDHVLVPLQRGQTPISYRPPGWVARGRPGSVGVPAGATAVLGEGVGACRREVRSFLDAMVWVYASPGVARRRVIAKGADTEEFINDWMAQENAFLADHRPWKCRSARGGRTRPAVAGRRLRKRRHCCRPRPAGLNPLKGGGLVLSHRWADDNRNEHPPRPALAWRGSRRGTCRASAVGSLPITTDGK